MTDKTINELTTTTTAAAADLLPIWVTASGVTRGVTKANFMGGAMTGGGTVATGGFTLTVAASGTVAMQSSGTWTPVLRFGAATTGITYTSASASYQRIGSMVFISADIRLSSKGTATGNADIGGLPFASIGSNYNTPIAFRWVTMTTALVEMTGILAAASSALALYGLASANATLGVLTDAAFSNTTILQLSGWYIA